MPLFRPELVDRQDIRMVERGGRQRFLLEAAHAASVIAEHGGQELDGNLAIEAGVLGEIDLAHSASAQKLGNSVVPEFPVDETRRACRFRRHHVSAPTRCQQLQIMPGTSGRECNASAARTIGSMIYPAAANATAVSTTRAFERTPVPDAGAFHPAQWHCAEYLGRVLGGAADRSVELSPKTLPPGGTLYARVGGIWRLGAFNRIAMTILSFTLLIMISKYVVRS